MCEFSMVLYLAHLLIAARSAAAPACMAVSCMCESAYVSGTVTSHAKCLPLAQGIKVAPSGRLPSFRLFDCRNFSSFYCPPD